MSTTPQPLFDMSKAVPIQSASQGKPLFDMSKAQPIQGGQQAQGTAEPSTFDTFSENVAKGMGLDTEKMKRLGGGSTGMQLLEAIRQLTTGAGNWMSATAKDPFHAIDPLNAMASGVTRAITPSLDVNTIQGAKDVMGGITDPTSYTMPKLAAKAGQMTGALSNVAAGVEAPEPARMVPKVADIAADVGSKVSDVVGHPIQSAQTVGREIMGVGPTTEAMQADAMSHAAAVKQHIVNVEDVVENRAKQAVAQPIQAIDSANPNGAFDKGNISDGVKEEVKDILKTPDAMGQLPASVRRMLVKEEAPSTTRALTSNELQTANIVQKEILDKGGGISDAKSMMANLGYAPKQIEAILSTLSGGAEASTTAAWTAEQLRQFRSAVGRDLGRYETKGEVGAAMNGVYNYLTGQLREAARNVSPDTEAAFLKGNAQYKSWMDDFHRSPLKKVLNGQTTGDVLKGLSAEQVPAILQKYKDVGMDTEGLSTEARRAKVGETIDRFSKPSKWDMVIGAIHPGYAAVRLGIPYLARHPAVLDWLAGKGMETPSEATPLAKIKAKQVAIRSGETADAQFQRLFGKEYKEAGDLAEWETGSREGGPATGGWKK